MAKKPETPRKETVVEEVEVTRTVRPSLPDEAAGVLRAGDTPLNEVGMGTSINGLKVTTF